MFSDESVHKICSVKCANTSGEKKAGCGSDVHGESTVADGDLWFSELRMLYVNLSSNLGSRTAPLKGFTMLSSTVVCSSLSSRWLIHAVMFWRMVSRYPCFPVDSARLTAVLCRLKDKVVKVYNKVGLGKAHLIFTDCIKCNCNWLTWKPIVYFSLSLPRMQPHMQTKPTWIQNCWLFHLN